MELECAILIGLQGAGKTAFYRTRLAGTHRHVSKDLFRHARNKNARQLAEIEAAFAAGASVAVDNTNPTPESRAPVIALARRFGARVVAYYFESTLDESLARNRARQGKARVPDVALFVTARKLTPPSSAEGFDRIYRVRIVGENEFDVRHDR